MEEAPPGYNKPRGLFLIGAGGRRRVGQEPRLRRSSSVDSLPKPPADWITGGSGRRVMPAPPADWILAGGYSPRSNESSSPKQDASGKKGKFALFRNLSSIISRPVDDWELSTDEQKERAERRDKHSEDAKKYRELKRLKKKERKKMKKHFREMSAAPSREHSSDLSLSARSRSSSNASEGDGKGKGGIEKLLRRAVSFVNGTTEEEMIVRDSGPESLFTSETDIVRAESQRVPLSEWYQGDGVDAEVVEEEKPKKKGLTRHNSLVRVRNLLKK